MNNILRPPTLKHLTIYHGGKIKWLEKENQEAEVKANPEKLGQYNARNVDVLFLRIKRNGLPSVYL